MMNSIVKNSICLIGITFLLLGNALAQERVPIEKAKAVSLKSLPDGLKEGTRQEIIENDEKKGSWLIVTYPPKGTKQAAGDIVYETLGGTWLMEEVSSSKDIINKLDAEIIKLTPNIEVPLSPTESLVAGPQGATLKRIKESKGVLLVEGEAYILKVEK